jgi:hypothetical protein
MSLGFRGLDLTNPVNRLAAGFVTVAQNIRAYTKAGVTLRNLLTGALYTLSAAVHSLKRLNDNTNLTALPSGYAIVNGAGTKISIWNSTNGVTDVAMGLSGNQVSMVPFRPNASPKPYVYIGDSAPQGNVTLETKYLSNGESVNYVSNGMLKVSSDNIAWKSGIKEPQLAPVVGTQNTSVPFGGGTGNLSAKTIPWTNYNGANNDYSYGETYGLPNPGTVNPIDGTTPFIVNCQNASTITITSLTGSATVNEGVHGPTDSSASWVGSNFPAYFIQQIATGEKPPSTASVIVGAFTTGDNAFETGGSTVVPLGVAPLYIPSVVDVGAAYAAYLSDPTSAAAQIPVPYGAVTFQIGINSAANSYNSNSGDFNISGTVTTNALPSTTAILGNLTAYYWGDSPLSGPVASYIWKNPSDPSGSGPTRSNGNADGNTSGNSFIFDATFASGIPELPGTGTQSLSMQWYQLNPDSVETGSVPVFAAPITTTYKTQTNYSDFNICLVGSIYVPKEGNYTFVLTSHDDVIWGIGGGATLSSATANFNGSNVTPTISDYGQTITALNGYPLLPRSPYPNDGNNYYAESTDIVYFPAAGIYPIELDFDYWNWPGRIILLMASPTPGASPTIIPPLPANIRQDVQYRYVYRSTATGAQSNPSPESTAEAIPVTANTITSLWSPDPQVDVVDYYRLDSVTTAFTYVNTGPNDNAGVSFSTPGNNTPVTDSLLDTALGTQTLDYDNYEPFPSIDLPQKGTCNVSGGVITWVSGGAIGGSSTGFNDRWLAGTTILIGSPTSLAYVLIARPVSNTITIPDVPDGTNLAYQIPQPILANQPLPYMWGPTDNINFCYAVGDPLRPGTLYWCKGSNLDSAPDTNQQEVTDPSESLINGAIAGGLGVLFSIKRAWLIMPNFGSATATATGTTGSTWTLQESSITRGLYIPRCVCVSGGGNIFFRVDDGIHVSSYGSASQSITDESLYPLFAHENSDGTGTQPQPITRNGVTIYPPDDTKPNLQRFSYNNGYMYWDHVGTDGNPHTLVFDEQAMGWILDTYTPAATIHAPNEGQSQQGVLVGCSDGTVRQITSGGTEIINGIVATPAMGGKGYMHCGQAVVEYSSSSTVTLSFFVADEGNSSYAPQTITLPSTGGQLTKYFFRPSANKWKLLTAQFSSSVPFVLNLQGAIFYLRAWGSSSAYVPTPIFGEAGGEG